MINVMDKIVELLASFYSVNTEGRDIREMTSRAFGLDDLDKTELELELEMELDIILPESNRLSWSTFGDLEKLIETELT